MAIKDEVRSSTAYIKINKGKDDKGKDIIVKAFKLPVATTVTDDKLLEMLSKVSDVTDYPLVDGNLDIIKELVDDTPAGI